VPHAAEYGIEWLIVEQDEGANESALERSYEVVAG
jgi:hypothetical protein